jgi:hypothetical protein
MIKLIVLYLKKTDVLGGKSGRSKSFGNSLDRRSGKRKASI